MFKINTQAGDTYGSLANLYTIGGEGYAAALAYQNNDMAAYQSSDPVNAQPVKGSAISVPDSWMKPVFLKEVLTQAAATTKPLVIDIAGAGLDYTPPAATSKTNWPLVIAAVLAIVTIFKPKKKRRYLRAR